MTNWGETAKAIGNLVAAGGDVDDIATLMRQADAGSVTYETLTAEPDFSTFHGTLPTFEDKPTDLGWQIVVLQRGWVVVGRVKRHFDELTIEDASVIRYWGTTKGLGELVDGPTSKTKLDAAGTIHANVLGVVLTLDVKADAWV